MLIAIKPLYALMKVGARSVYKSSAEKAGVPWEAITRALSREPVALELESLRVELTNPRVVYPEYYTQPFHAYDEGNLCWLAAQEVDAATASMAVRTFRKSDPGMDPALAQAKLREGIHARIREYRRSSSSGGGGGSSGLPLFEDVLDIGGFFVLFSFSFFSPFSRSRESKN